MWAVTVCSHAVKMPLFYTLHWSWTPKKTTDKPYGRHRREPILETRRDAAETRKRVSPLTQERSRITHASSLEVRNSNRQAGDRFAKPEVALENTAKPVERMKKPEGS